MMYRYYIGSNNVTGDVEEDKVISIISSIFEGFTSFRSIGSRRGKIEKSLIVEIESEDESLIARVAEKLVKELHQEAIGILAMGRMNFVHQTFSE